MGLKVRCSIMVWLLVAWISAASSELEYEILAKTECSFTRYPTLCVETLMESNVTGKSEDIVDVLVEQTLKATARHLSVRRGPSVSATSPDYCDELMEMSLQRLNQSLTALRKSLTKYKQDVQTWLSAVLTYQDNCKDWATSDAQFSSSGNNNKLSTKQIPAQMDHLSQLASNALALINRITISNSTNHPNPRRQDLEFELDSNNFPTWVSHKDRKILLDDAINPNVVVAKDGSGHYKTVGEAIKAASSVKDRHVIYIKSGVYKEKIRIKRDGITLVGEGKDSTVIESGSSVRRGSSLIETATVAVSGDNFIARDIGFRNTAGVEGEQAIALAVASDHAVLYHCKISGHQDTLFAQSLRQFYRECDISGTIDFIFGNAAAVFQSCNIQLEKPKGSNAVMASGRTDPGQNTGFSIHRCRIVARSELAPAPVKHSYKSYLGRPWKQYARSVVMLSYIDDSIASKGWLEWSGSRYLSTLYYGEFENKGPGSSTSGRVSWSGYHVMGRSDAVKFTVGNFIGGSSWIPQANVNFVSGL